MLRLRAKQQRRAGGDLPQYVTGSTTDPIMLGTIRQDRERGDDLPRYEPRKELDEDALVPVGETAPGVAYDSSGNVGSRV